MRVLLDCRMASWSGVGRYTVGLAHALARRTDIDLILVCAGDTSALAPCAGHSDILSAHRHPLGPCGAVELSRLAAAARPDLVHCLHFPTPVPVRGPLVVTLHDLTPLLVPGVMPSSLRRAVYRCWNRRAVCRADGIIAPSSATAADLARVFPDAGRAAVIPEAADDFAAGDFAELEARLQCLAASPYILSMGNTRGHKDLGTLLRAFASMATSHPDCRLLLVGAEPPGYLDSMLAGSPSARARVTFTGRVSDAELRTLYAGATVFAFPSRHEGFGLPPLEAMALGAPVVCAAAASLPEVVGGAALLFSAGDALSLARALDRILTDVALRRRLTEAGRRQAARFTWDRTAAGTVAEYRTALAHYRQRRP